MNSDAAGVVRTLVAGFFRLYPDEAATFLDSLAAEEIVPLLGEAPRPAQVAVIEGLTPDTGAQVLERLPAESFRVVAPALDPSRAAALLVRLEEHVAGERLALLDPGVARELRALMSHPADSAGHLMDPRITTVHPDALVRDVLTRLQTLRPRRVHDVLLVEPSGRLAGMVAIHEIALADPDDRVGALVRTTPPAIPSTASHEEAVETMTQRRLTTLPVVDFEGRVLGAIRHDRIIAAAREEASADLLTMVGASKEERALSSVGFAVRKRLPWLQVNLATAFLAAAVVGIFEGTIARFTALAVLLPVVAGQSGNTGAQALAVTMRGLALREIRLRHWPRLSWKEVNVSAINGLAVALVTALGVVLWSRSPGLSLVIGGAMVLSMMAAGLAGAAIPMVLTRLGQDPAQSSSIILTTVTDVVGFLSFLGLATMFAAAL